MVGISNKIAAAVLLAGAAPAFAGPLEILSEVRAEQRVAAADGTTRTVFVLPRRVGPGDRIVFTLRYRNTGAQSLGDVVLANPVPRGIAYRAPVPGTPEPEVSVDGTRYGPLASLRRGPRAAVPGDVVAVRWRLARPLSPGATGTLAFQGAVK